MEYINKLLHRAASTSPRMSPSPTPTSGNDNLTPKTAEHEVKVRFAREFADAGLVAENLCSARESLSSASSFHSISSTLSTKSSSGICPDSTSDNSDDIANTSYVNRNISGVEDLILACADIHLGSDCDTQNLSQDQTFASATDGTSFHASDCSLNEDALDSVGNETRVIENSQLKEACVSLDQTHTFESFIDATLVQDSESVTPPAKAGAPQIEESIKKHIPPEESDNTVNEFETACNITCSIAEDSLPASDADNNQLNVTATISPDSLISNVVTRVLNEERAVEDSCSAETPPVENSELCPIEVSVPSAFSPVQHTDLPSPTVSSILLEDSKAKESSEHNLSEPAQEDASSTALSSSNDIDQQSSVLSQATVNSSVVEAESKEIIIRKDSPQPYDCIGSDSKEDNTQLLNTTSIVEPKVLEVRENVQTSVDRKDSEIRYNVLNETQNIVHGSLSEKENAICNETRVVERNLPESVKENLVESATPLNAIKENALIEEELDRTLTLQELDINFALDEEQYEDFKPQRQSTTLSLINKEADFEELKSTAQQLTNELLNPKLELADETETEKTEEFVSATAEIFQDPSIFDFLLARSDSNRINRLRAESLYIKFDPLVSNINMLPQGNAQSVNEEQNGKSESPVPNVDTPKRNPALAAIDRLLFYSPLPSGTDKIEEAQEKNEQPVEEPKSDAPLIADHVDMSKELELVRTTVLQLEDELEKQKKEHKAELEKQKEKINKLQTQIAQEVKTKSQMTVVVEEYEKSISRLLTEREKDRTNFEQEKAKLQEELQAANHHLTNTEAAFNDVHQKYERLKGVVSAYKNNETVLKESIQENVDTIKTLETRYDQLKEHAMTQLEKANLELDGIRKQNEAETVKLHAMIRKAELKSNSLAELVEQKTKENKELTKILDEVIARVAPGNSE
ncbi:transforming acidic coiled-coil-containing protein 3 isoform X2 [Linepithema humile]|uniref:transforming acidic coiled-coil-containing protein 3 isoform X2 n=1 Tax=Linepithema humile TaxID=83485 RepID=UPI00062359E5|nr:PREDICTED: transforming acidic coiled-coil-containing protein 3 isoform X2 [Linepithema humile]